MNILKKLNLFVIGIISLTSYSCTSPVNQISESTKNTSFNAKTNTITINESNNSASINFKLLINQSDFNTKASSSGTTQGQAVNINKVNIQVANVNADYTYTIISDTTFTPNTSFINNVPKTYTISGFKTAGTYYVGVQLFNGNDNLLVDQGGVIGKTAISSPFTVSVNNGVITPSVSSVSIAASLRNGIGAKIETDIKHKDGSPTLSAISVY